MRKHINSETTKYQDELTEVLVLDDKPVVNSFNGITSDAVARAVAGASGEVPQVTESDNGKVLKAIYDEGGPAVEWGDAAPAVTVDQTYNASSTNAQSGTAVAGALSDIKQVPASTSADANKVLTVNSSGVPGWATAQGGGSSYTAGDGIKIANSQISADFSTVQKRLTFGSDFRFVGESKYYVDALANDSKWIPITANVACEFTFPGTAPNSAYGSGIGSTINSLQIVNSSGTVLATLATQSVSIPNQPMNSAMTTNVEIPAGNSGNYLRYHYAYANYMGQTEQGDISLDGSFDTSTPCYFVPYSGTLAVNFPAVPTILVDKANFGQQNQSTGHFYYSWSGRSNQAKYYELTISAVVPSGTAKAVVGFSGGTYVVPVAKAPSVLPSIFTGTGTSVVQFTAKGGNNISFGVNVIYYDASDNVIDSAAWGALAVPTLTVIQMN